MLQIMHDNVVVLFSYRQRVQGGEGGRKRVERKKGWEKEEKG